MKKTVLTIALSSSILFSSCIGSFKLTNKILDWNNGVGDKFLNELVFVGLWVIPVYEISLLGDAVIFNAFEFWGASNPISMKEGEIREKTFASKGVDYKMTLTKNHMKIATLDGSQTTNMVYLPEDASWNLETKDGLVKLSQLQDENINGKQMIKIFRANNETALIEAESIRLSN